MSYLFLGQDSLSKDIKLEKIKEECLVHGFEQFNFDCLYAKELDLWKLQEALLRLPTKSRQRIVLIRDAEKLKEDVKEYLAHYVKKPFGHVQLILDVREARRSDHFLVGIAKYVKVLHFGVKEAPDTFRLCQEIESRSIKSSLKILDLLLSSGEKPEMIMGGLRYHWQKNYLPQQERAKRLRLLLSCDCDIKTGRLKPAFALERLLITLCC